MSKWVFINFINMGYLVISLTNYESIQCVTYFPPLEIIKIRFNQREFRFTK